MKKAVEICVESADGALSAWKGGADRVEICAHRAVGGVTPGYAEVARACRELTIPVHVLIRPRPGNFVYDRDEFARMSSDVARSRTCGALGVVLGVLRADGTIDRKRTETLVEAAGPLSVTFHKAFDLVPDPFEALETLIALKLDRVLTSGQAPTAREGAALLAKLVSRATGRITILGGGSLGLDDLPEMRAAGLSEVHAGSSAECEGKTDEALVRRLVLAWVDRVDPPPNGE